MESRARKAPRPRGLRPLGLPRLVEVVLGEDGLPYSVARLGGRVLGVMDVEEVWRIGEEWWRDDPIVRTYYRLILADGRPLTVFHDDTQGRDAGWYAQRY